MIDSTDLMKELDKVLGKGEKKTIMGLEFEAKPLGMEEWYKALRLKPQETSLMNDEELKEFVESTKPESPPYMWPDRIKLIMQADVDWQIKTFQHREYVIKETIKSNFPDFDMSKLDNPKILGIFNELYISVWENSGPNIDLVKKKPLTSSAP